MDRLQEILKFVSKTGKGIEIAPWFSPLAPKREGYNCASIDILSAEQLIARAAADPNIPKEKLDFIEPVDFIGSAVDIAEIVAAKEELGSFDYIISSHNFEHLPNPIRFLQGCQKVLKPGGILSMAIPDMRATFDHFRPRTSIGDWLEAYFKNRTRPELSQVFDQVSHSCRLTAPPGRETAFMIDDNPAMIKPDELLDIAYKNWVALRENPDSGYIDTHCSVGTISSLRLLITECRFLGLIDLVVKEVAGPNGCEFFLHLERGDGQADHAQFKTGFYRERARLLHQIEDELAKSSSWGWSQRQREVAKAPNPGLLSKVISRLFGPRHTQSGAVA